MGVKFVWVGCLKICSVVKNMVKFCLVIWKEKEKIGNDAENVSCCPLYGLAINHDKSCAENGLGILVRDHVGWVAVACSDSLPSTVEPNLLLPLALSCALSFARDAGFTNLIIEGVCTSLVSVLNSKSVDISAQALILEDIHHVLVAFRQVSFNHISPSDNRAACVFAVETCSLEFCCEIKREKMKSMHTGKLRTVFTLTKRKKIDLKNTP